MLFLFSFFIFGHFLFRFFFYSFFLFFFWSANHFDDGLVSRVFDFLFEFLDILADGLIFLILDFLFLFLLNELLILVRRHWVFVSIVEVLFKQNVFFWFDILICICHAHNVTNFWIHLSVNLSYWVDLSEIFVMLWKKFYCLIGCKQHHQNKSFHCIKL